MEKNEHTSNGRRPVLLVPGGVNPAVISYGPLLEVLKDEAYVVVKDLEVYAADTPPPGYGLEVEVEGIKRAAEAADLKSFHLVGYSGGGAACLAFIVKDPELVRSLALIEPAWIGNDPEDVNDWSEMERVMALPLAERMPAFMRAGLRPGVETPPPPPGPPAPWMAKRPAGLEAMTRAFRAYHLEREDFRHFRRPVYLALGSLSHPMEEHKAEVLSSLFPDMRVEVYEGLHHFNPPHRAEPERFARALRELWARSEVAASVKG
ncbi:MAG TPA: alpha/beta hydrolase [Ktedonobacteraceae bacterium]